MNPTPSPQPSSPNRVRLTAHFRRARQGFGIALRQPGPGEQPSASPASPPPDLTPPLARTLALAHRLQAMLDTGEVADRSALARMLCVSSARVTHVLDLLHLAPDLQERILLASSTEGLPTRRLLQRIVAEPDWGEQRAMWTTATQLGRGPAEVIERAPSAKQVVVEDRGLRTREAGQVSRDGYA